MYRGAVYYLHNKTACTHKVLHLIDNRFIIKKKKRYLSTFKNNCFILDIITIFIHYFNTILIRVTLIFVINKYCDYHTHGYIYVYIYKKIFSQIL